MVMTLMGPREFASLTKSEVCHRTTTASQSLRRTLDMGAQEVRDREPPGMPESTLGMNFLMTSRATQASQPILRTYASFLRLLHSFSFALLLWF